MKKKTSQKLIPTKNTEPETSIIPFPSDITKSLNFARNSIKKSKSP